MRTYTIICLCLGLAAAAKQGKHFNQNLDEFDKEFHINIVGETDEQKAERGNQLKNVEEEINKQNDARANGKATFSEALYEFSLMSKEDFKATHTGVIEDDPFEPADRFRPSNLRREAESIANFQARMADRSVPDEFNAVEKGYVTSVRNQGYCGSCSAFAAQAMHEATLVKAGASSTNLDLSEQYLLDCGGSERRKGNGCYGARLQDYQDWFVKNGGLSPLETDYPYILYDYLDNKEIKNYPTVCNNTIQKYDPGYKMSSHHFTSSCNEEMMKSLVFEYGAVATTLHANHPSFQNYKEGVYSGCPSTKRDHAVIVVGYGTDENDGDYWLVKNSWGSWWGENGYGRIKRGNEECGIGKVCVWGEATATGGNNDQVNCGGHQADSCEKCPQGNGKSWCNGDCKWTSQGQCTDKKSEVCINLKLRTKSWAKEISWQFGSCKSPPGYGEYIYGKYADHKEFTIECCQPAGTYELECMDTYGDGWHGGSIEIGGTEYCKDFRGGHSKKQQVEH